MKYKGIFIFGLVIFICGITLLKEVKKMEMSIKKVSENKSGILFKRDNQKSIIVNSFADNKISNIKNENSDIKSENSDIKSENSDINNKIFKIKNDKISDAILNRNNIAKKNNASENFEKIDNDDSSFALDSDNSEFLSKVNDIVGQRKELSRPRFDGFGKGNDGIAKNYYSRAIDAKKAGDLFRAVNFYSKAIEESRDILIEPDMGLGDMLLAQAEKKSKEFPTNEFFLAKLTYYYDVFGETENAFRTSRKLLALTNEESFRNYAFSCLDQAVVDQDEYYDNSKENFKSFDETKNSRLMDKVVFMDSEEKYMPESNKDTITVKNVETVKNVSKTGPKIDLITKELYGLKTKISELQRANQELKEALIEKEKNKLSTPKKMLSMNMSDIKNKLLNKSDNSVKNDRKNSIEENLNDLKGPYLEIETRDGKKVVQNGSTIKGNIVKKMVKKESSENMLILKRLKDAKGFMEVNNGIGSDSMESLLNSGLTKKTGTQNMVSSERVAVKSNNGDNSGDKKSMRWLDIKKRDIKGPETAMKTFLPDAGFGVVEMNSDTTNIDKIKKISSIEKTKKISFKKEVVNKKQINDEIIKKEKPEEKIVNEQENRFRYLNIVDLTSDNSSYVKRFSAISFDGKNKTGALELKYSAGPMGTFKIEAQCDVLNPEKIYYLSNRNSEVKVSGMDGFDYRLKLLSVDSVQARVALEVSSKIYSAVKKNESMIRL